MTVEEVQFFIDGVLQGRREILVKGAVLYVIG